MGGGKQAETHNQHGTHAGTLGDSERHARGLWHPINRLVPRAPRGALRREPGLGIIPRARPPSAERPKRAAQGVSMKRDLKAKTECRACGRKGHWANDRECGMSSSSSSTQNQTRTARMATRQQLTDRANQIGACFVLNEYSDDPDTSACRYGWTPRTSSGRSDRAGILDADRFRRHRHQGHSRFQRSCHGRQ